MDVLNKKAALGLRLKRLHAATGKTWDVLATELGIKRAMIFHVLSGRRGFSDNALDRLAQLEVAAGVRSEASVLIERGLDGGTLIKALLEADGSTHNAVTVRDIDAGSKEIQLEYRRGSPPADFPTQIKVIAAKNATIWQIIGENGVRKIPADFLIACLPDLQNRPEVLERLTPTCYALILDAALDLTFGLNWRSKL